MSTETRTAPSHVWIDVPARRVFACAGGETFELAGGLGVLGGLEPFAAQLKIKARGIDLAKWRHVGRLPLPGYALGAYPIRHN